MTITITEHRTRLKNNPNAFEEHYEKARGNFAKMFKGYPLETRLQLADLVFEAQGRKPLLHWTNIDGLPCAWNDAKRLHTKNRTIHTWDDCDYIRYEIGHMNPRNAGGTNDPENLCFMSGKCNQHVQASLPLDIVLRDYFPTNLEVQNRVANLKKLHNSKKWRKLTKQPPHC